MRGDAEMGGGFGEHFRVKSLQNCFKTIEENQVPVDGYLTIYITKRPHQGYGVNGRTPTVAFGDRIPEQAKKVDEGSLRNAQPATSARVGKSQRFIISTQSQAAENIGSESSRASGLPPILPNLFHFTS